MSGSKPQKVISWDACAFLGWFKREDKKPLEDMRAWLRDVELGKAGMIVSAVVCAEVLDTLGSDEAGTLFRQWVKRTSVLRADVSWRIAETAAEFREMSKAAQILGLLSSGFKAPDALIAATAVHFKADVLHSFDPVLNDLSGSEIIGGLVVTPPAYEHPSAPLFGPEAEIAEKPIITLPDNWRELAKAKAIAAAEKLPAKKRPS